MAESILHFSQGMAFASLLFCSLYFLRLAPNRNRPQIVLGWVLLMSVVENVKDMALLVPSVGCDDWMRDLLSIVDIVSVPPCVFFTKELMFANWLTWRRVCRHEWPFVALILLYALTALPSLGAYAHHVLHAALAYSVGYTLYNIYVLDCEAKAFNRRLRDLYSYTETLDISWMRKVLVLFLLKMMLYAFTVAFYSVAGDIVYYTLAMLLWLGIFYFASRQQVAVEMAQQAVAADAAGMEEASAAPRFAEALERLMHGERLYLNPRLTIGDVAQRVGTNRTYLSHYINQAFHKTFLDYVNDLRLDHAVRMLQRGNAKIAVVAEESGFSSPVTFRRYFKSRYGCTPGEYLPRALHDAPGEAAQVAGACALAT